LFVLCCRRPPGSPLFPYTTLFRSPVTEWMAGYRKQIDDVRAALGWAFCPSGNAAVGVALTIAAVPLWTHLSLMEECRGRVDQALASLEPAAGRDRRREMQLLAALGAALMYTKGAVPAKRAAFARALELADDLADTAYRLRRSEEHTSELQSPDHLVCRLLLE